MRWLKIAGICLVALVVLSLVSFVIKMIELLVTAIVVVALVAAGVWIYISVQSAQDKRLDRRQAKATRTAKARTQKAIEEELNRLKRDLP